MASLDLWVDWDDEGESAGWHAPLTLPLSRFLEDDTYAQRVSTHIQQALDNLAKEVEQIGIVKSRGQLRNHARKGRKR